MTTLLLHLCVFQPALHNGGLLLVDHGVVLLRLANAVLALGEIGDFEIDAVVDLFGQAREALLGKLQCSIEALLLLVLELTVKVLELELAVGALGERCRGRRS